jgi:hypothetical protein
MKKNKPMTSIRKLASALCLATFCSFSNAQQIDTTGNLINNGNWSGATYGVDPNDCCSSVSGSGALYDTASDTIKFSYGLDTLIQTIGLQQALGGTGVQVHGYNYSFDYRLMPNNALHTDNLTASIWLTTSSGFHTEVTHLFLSGQVALGVNDQWNDISGTRSFASPYVDPQSITMRFEGRDGGFWAGYYGPEVRNISLSVNYAFDPCASDPLYSSSCPGYLEAYMANLFALLGWSSTPESEVDLIDYSLSTIVSQPVRQEETTTGEIKVDAGGIEVSTTGELSVPDGIPEETKEKKPVDMNLISRIVREATDETATMAIVNQSIEQSMDENANPDFSMTNETLASISRQTENSIQQSLTENQDLNAMSVETSQSESTPDQEIVQFESSQIVIEQQNESSQQSIVDISQSAVSIIFDAQNVSTEVTNLPQNITQGQSNTYEFQTETKVETSELQNQSLPRASNEDQKETTQTVKKEVRDNEAAGGVEIDSIATEPLNFDTYLNKQLADIQFYKTEEIYKNLEPVDNRRSLRLLSGANDRLHQEMVNEQYK